MKKKIVGFIVCILLAAGGPCVPLSFVSSGDPLDSEVVDQSQEICGESKFFDTYTWQAFVPTQTTLVRVEVCLAQNFGLSPDITLSIEQPLETLLTSLTLPVSAIPSETCDWVSFDVSNITLVPGETYYIVLSYPPGGEYSWCGASGDLYVPGNSNREVDWDWCFRTFAPAEEISGPDLVVTDIWNENGDIWYQLHNIGNIPADAGHSTALFVNDDFIVSDTISEMLNPSERTNRMFDYSWVCTPLSDMIEARADEGDIIPEINETNNNRVEQWNCDTLPPEIVSGPLVQDITQERAVIVWGTSEESNSLVSYGTVSGFYTNNVANESLSSIHHITLQELAPSTTYHFRVESSDLTGNTIRSSDLFFETVPAPDSIPPLVDMEEPGECQQSTLISVTAQDNQGVEKVIFYINNLPVFTDFSVPFEFLWDTTRYPNGPYELKTRVVDLMGQTSEDQVSTTVANPIDETAPQVRIVYPHTGDTLTHEVLITAYLQDDVDLNEGICYVDGVEHARTTYPEQIDYVAFTFLWDTYDVENGPHRIGVVANDSDGKNATGYVDVMIENPPKSEPNVKVIGHSIFPYNNKANVKVFVQNVGAGIARNVTVVDHLSGFLPVSGDWGAVNYSVRYDPVNKISSCVIEDTGDLLPNEVRQYEYAVIPILFDPVSSLWVGTLLQVSFESVYHERIMGQSPFAVNAKQVTDAYNTAVMQADYLLLTNPQRLFDNFGGKKGGDNDVNTLLATMGELAYYRDAVLGFVSTNDSQTIRNLLKPGGAWETKMHSPTNYLQYLLIVGENGIVPSWTLNKLNLTDLFYANTMGDGAPDLVVGRVIGDHPVNLARVMRTSINVVTNQPGYGFDRSHMLLMSGTGDHCDMFVDFVNDLTKILQNDTIVEKLHLYSFLTKNEKLKAFSNHSSDQDVICYRGHGQYYSCDDIVSTNFSTPYPISFSSTNPFVFALACLTGRYDKPYSIAQAFLDTKAAVFIGATEVSNAYRNSEAGKYFFTNLWNPGVSIGDAFLLLKNTYWDPSDFGWQDWITIYNLYGDPKYGAVSSNGLSSMSPDTMGNGNAASLVDVQIPACETISHDGYDYVDIPGGLVLVEDGGYRIPFYAVSLEYPAGVEVQNVLLTEKTNLSVANGMNLPIVENIVDDPVDDPLPPNAPFFEEWYPCNDYEWNVRANTDGSSTLRILMYPLKYNPLTMGLQSYRNYSFAVDYIESPVRIVRVTTKNDAYHQGDIVGINIEMNNTGASQDVIVNAVIIQSGTETVIDGLLLSTLDECTGSASFSPQWDSTGTPPGYYYAEVTLSDTQGRLLDRETSLFGVDLAAGAISAFSVSPQYFDIGDTITVDLTFTNTGPVVINGTTYTTIQDMNGSLVHAFSHTITDLQPTQSISYTDEWDSSSALERSYKVLSHVLYESRSSNTMVQLISTNYPPIVHFTYTPQPPILLNQPVQFNTAGSSSDPDGSIVSWVWDFSDGSMSTEQNPTHAYAYPGNYIVTLIITDNEGATNTTSAFIMIGDFTPPSITIEVPSPGEALQDGVTFCSLVMDPLGVAWVKYAIREPGGVYGTMIDLMYEALDASPAADNRWVFLFDTTQLPDGYYVLYVNARDTCGNIGNATMNFSIRNWAVLAMLPNTPNSKAGRTMPVKFSLRIAPAVDPAEPFVRNEELTILIYEKNHPEIILQTSTYGPNATDYRIDAIQEHYITNFKTLSKPKTYVVEIWRIPLLIGSFEFNTIK